LRIEIELDIFIGGVRVNESLYTHGHFLQTPMDIFLARRTLPSKMRTSASSTSVSKRILGSAIVGLFFPMNGAHNLQQQKEQYIITFEKGGE